MWPLASRTGTVSVKVPVPCSRQTSVTGGVGREELDELGDAAVVDEGLDVGAVCPGVPGMRRSSRITRVSPGTRKEVWRARATSPS